MDLFVENERKRVALSSLGIQVKDYEETNAAIEMNQATLKNKNGKLFYGATYTEKRIKISCNYYVEDEYEYEKKKDQLNSILASTTPFYITKMVATSNLYDFERPGERIDFDLLNIHHRMYHYRHRVMLEGEIEYEFLGKSKRGLLTECSLSFVTADIPFGITIPCEEDVTNKETISYRGTAACGQLEWPWKIQLEITENSGNLLEFILDDQVFVYEGTKKLVTGDRLLLSGTSFTLNGLNINDQTNCVDFILKPSMEQSISYNCSVPSRVSLLNKVEFYL